MAAQNLGKYVSSEKPYKQYSYNIKFRMKIGASSEQLYSIYNMYKEIVFSFILKLWKDSPTILPGFANDYSQIQN